MRDRALEQADSTHGYRPRYRADIDGLRAIAIVAVIVFHVWNRALPAGFLGVDVFFVISGFLITTILVRESEAGAYSIARFYDRRIRRIMPALLATLVATTAIVWLIFLPSDAAPYGRSVLATLAFVSNVWFWRSGQDYFAGAATMKPLLHTWSLGIEEQFYILFPILVLCLMKLGGRRTTGWGIATISVVSFALASAAQAINKGVVPFNPLPMNTWDVGLTGFYLLPMRAWELGLGAGVAMLREPCAVGRGVRTALSAGALALLVASLAVVEPSGAAALPSATFACVATTILIWAGGPDNPVSRLIGARPLAAVGLVSYSLYLWHWPVYVLGGYFLIREPKAAEALAMMVLAVALATLSWRYLEQPFRGRGIPTRRVLAILAVPIVGLLAVAWVLRETVGAPDRFPPALAVYDRAITGHFECPVANRLPFGGIRGCVLAATGNEAAGARVVLFGNSHAGMYAPAVEAVLARRGLKGLLVTTGGCLPITEFNVTNDCVPRIRGGIEAVARLTGADTVIVATTWPREGPMFDAAGREIAIPDWPHYLAALQRTLDRFDRAGKHVVLVGPLPWPGYDTTSTAARELALRGHVESALMQSRADYAARFGPVDDWLSTLASRIAVVRPAALLCDRARCAFELAGKPAFSDGNHLSIHVLPSFEPLFDEALDKALPPSDRVRRDDEPS